MGAMKNPGPNQRQPHHLREFSRFLERNVWLIAFSVLALVVLASAFLVRSVPVYEGRAWVRVDQQRSNVAVLDALENLSGGSQIGTEIAVLRTRLIAEDVVERLALHVILERPRVPRSEILSDVHAGPDARAYTYRFQRAGDGFTVEDRRGVRHGPFHPGELIRLDGVSLALAPAALTHDELRVAVQPFEDALTEFRRTAIISRPDREADIIQIRYESDDPVLARAVPNTMAAVFIARRQDEKSQTARARVAFLREQVDTLSGQLLLAEDDLRRFREAERVVHVQAEAEAHIRRLAEMQAQREMLEAERQAMLLTLADLPAPDERLRDDQASPFRRLAAFPSLLKYGASAELLGTINELENQRAELLTRRSYENPDVQILTGRLRELEEQLNTIAQAYLHGLTHHVASLDAALARFVDELDQVPAREIQFARLRRQATVLEEIHTLLQTSLKETEVMAAVQDPSVRVVDPAPLPARPIRPQKRLTLLMALLLGGVVGVGVGFLREQLDDSIHTREELQLATGDLPVLGLIPRIAGALNGGRPLHQRVLRRNVPIEQARLVTGRDPRSPISEAYRSLRTNITFARPDSPPRTLVFTSAAPGDGKSTSAANLALTLSQQGLRPLLIDADLRRGSLNEELGVAREPGLTDLLLRGRALEDVRHRVAFGDTDLEFVSTGVLPPNPAELLGSERTRALLERLEADYDMVILDAPPLNVVTDAALLGTNADGVVLVVRAGVTSPEAITYALEQLAAVRAPVLGTVLNDLDLKKERYHGGVYGYYYAAADPKSGA